MKINFLGAAGTVTGSSYILTSQSGQSIIIDLGMFQGPEIEQLNYEPYDFVITKLSGAVLTHAHLDHCGRVPLLVKNGFSGSIWMTEPTAELTTLALFDSAKIAYEDHAHALYDKTVVEKTLQQFKTISYGKTWNIGCFQLRFYNAGHILGSASVEIRDNSATSSVEKIIFSGDLGNSPDDLTKDTEYIDASDAVVMESTYGDKDHSTGVPAHEIETEIHAIEKSGGTLLIPAFSLHRTQELLHIIKHLKLDQKISPSTPVFLDSPMAESATEIYQKYPDDLNTHIADELKTDSPFQFPELITTHHRHESEAIKNKVGPKIVIAGSGMMVGGRIVQHAANFLSKSSTRLLIVGYQGEQTLGRELLSCARSVVINGRTIAVQATVNHIDTMSSHAGQSQLIKWLSHIKGVQHVMLTHGDQEPRIALATKIRTELGVDSVYTPSMHEEIEL